MLLGKVVDKRYQVLLVLSDGGLLKTYIARDVSIPSQPLCVVKHLDKATGNDKGLWQNAKQLLTREAEVLNRLHNHDRIHQLLAFFEKNQALYLVREYIKGVPLNLEFPSDDCWKESQVVQLLQDVLDILKFIHARKVVHLDIRPENIIKREHDSRAVLINFGLSQQFSPLAALERRISAASTIDKPNPKSDISALGLLGIQALTGQYFPQFTQYLNATETLNLSRVQINAELVSLLDKMVRYNSRNCYWTVDEVIQALQPLVNLYLPKQVLRVPTRSSAIATNLPQDFSPDNPSTASSGNGSVPPVIAQMSNASEPNSHDRSLLLIGISIGISTTVALVLGFLWMLSATPDDSKKPVSHHLQDDELVPPLEK